MGARPLLKDLYVKPKGAVPPPSLLPVCSHCVAKGSDSINVDIAIRRIIDEETKGLK